SKGISERVNVGRHADGDNTTTEDVRHSLEDMMTIIEWYFEAVRPEGDKDPTAVDKQQPPTGEQRNPKLALKHCNRGIELRLNKQYAEAEAEFREAIRLIPDDPDFHNHLGLALIPQRRFEEAEVGHRSAAGLNPA